MSASLNAHTGDQSSAFQLEAHGYTESVILASHGSAYTSRAFGPRLWGARVAKYAENYPGCGCIYSAGRKDGDSLTEAPVIIASED
jgi:hypothetical protein